jgi:MFS family permease
MSAPAASGSQAKVSSSTWAPLASKTFAALWVAMMVSNLGTWMQTVGAQWMLVTQSNASVLVSLVQTATTLPVMLLSMPAGVMADLVNRRKMLIIVQICMGALAAVLALLTWRHLVTPPLLLAMLFVLGCGQALIAPAWQAIQPELVKRELIPSAAALGSMNVNVARAVGPAVAGFLVATKGGPALVFALNAVSFVFVVGVLMVWREPVKHSSLPSERPLQALDSGFRFIRAAPAIRRVLLRAFIFIFPASALWALLPLVAKKTLDLGSSGYGIMLGALGVGAVVGAMLLGRMRRIFNSNVLLIVSAIVFGLGTLVLAIVRIEWVVLVAMLFAGMAWLISLSTVNSAMQLMLPSWVRARGLALYQLVFMGGQAIGSVLWGFAGSRLGISTALLVSAALLLLAALSVWPWPMTSSAASIDTRTAAPWPEPNVFFDPEPTDGPVMVLNEYDVQPDKEHEFFEAMGLLARSRRRTGAMWWELFRDPRAPHKFVESFVVRSWAEHMMQHQERLTGVDRENEDRVEELLVRPSRVIHLIGATEDQVLDPSVTEVTGENGDEAEPKGALPKASPATAARKNSRAKGKRARKRHH